MKKQASVALAVMVIITLIGCTPRPKARGVELEKKGDSAPEWANTYIDDGTFVLKAQSEFKDKYSVIGKESGVNLQAVLDRADSGALRFDDFNGFNNELSQIILIEYYERIKETVAAQSQGGPNSSTTEGTLFGKYNLAIVVKYTEDYGSINKAINNIRDLNYPGMQREDDWWSLYRRYDPDQKGVFIDEYTAYVLYTIPKAELNRQVAEVLSTAVKADSVLYDINVELVRQILEDGIDNFYGVTR